MKSSMSAGAVRANLRVRALLSPAIVLIPLFVATSHVTAAHAMCSPQAANPEFRYPSTSGLPWFAGIDKSDSTAYAAKADILNYQSWVYGASQPSAWVMIDNSNGCAACYLAQIGWEEIGNNDGYGDSTRYTFEGYTSYSNGHY